MVLAPHLVQELFCGLAIVACLAQLVIHVSISTPEALALVLPSALSKPQELELDH